MKNLYRKFLIITIVLLASFLTTVVIRSFHGTQGLLEFIKNSGAYGEVITLDQTHRDAPITPSEVHLLSQLNDEYTKITAAVMPAVVSLDSSGMGNKRVRDRFGRIRTLTENVMNQGSGVLVSPQGHIITNYHVVSGMKEISARLSNGKSYKATLVGKDSALDIAVLKIEGEETLPTLPFADSDQVREGNIVFAFGNPFGIGKSMTHGVISARERSISDLQGGLFQSSVAINPGYSGGPLVNIFGEIIGINSNILSNNDKNPGFQGISFSIPSNIVKRTYQDILTRGKPVRGFLGVAFAELTPAKRALLEYNGEYGAYIDKVGPGTPAAAAGILKGDIITNFDKHPLRDAEQFIGFIQRSEIGKPLPLTIWRQGKEIQSAVTLEEFNPDIAQFKPELGGQNNILQQLGITVGFLDSKHRRAGVTGVIVRGVEADSLADGQIMPGDIIYQINRYRMNQPNEFYDLVEYYAVRKDIELYVIREGQVLAEPVMIEKFVDQ
ncbi:trypsin-like peptidase domain-containing protein [Rubritalea marina]|uniref:trypsin-like peptidase domain-containing protein n=1 Tax=Rubritalea marina TaxID=361055 RepID=UPI00037EBEA4|nr:trypsin-like peptidase domain-containing protein [Rubritalea marina]